MFSSVKYASRGTASVLVLGQFKGQSLDKATRELDIDGVGVEAAKRPEATGELGSIAEAFVTTKGKGKPQRVLVVGLGDKDAFNATKLEGLAVTIGKHLVKVQADSVAVELWAAISSMTKKAMPELAECGKFLGEGFGLSAWTVDEFRGSATTIPKRPALTVLSADADFSAGIRYGMSMAEAINLTRTISETPPNICTPEWVANQARSLARKTGMSCSVTKANKLLDEGCVGIFTVGQASENAPCMIRLEYTPERPRRGAKPVVLVGKTMTYDSGGLSIKVGGSMVGMKRDMDGGAGVLGAMHAIATLIKPRVPVVAYLCAAENAISDEAYRPDDIITFDNGVTVEVTNTDAEGRLVLADGLIKACKEKPACVIDMATLTGGVVVALGSTFAGMWCDDNDLREKIEAASCRSGDRVWRLPHHEEYRELMRSRVADIVNSAPVREAHPIQGAAFLSYFVEEGTPWCHLDIAGVHSYRMDKGGIEKGSCTGFGVRLLAELIESM